MIGFRSLRVLDGEGDEGTVKLVAVGGVGWAALAISSENAGIDGLGVRSGQDNPNHPRVVVQLVGRQSGRIDTSFHIPKLPDKVVSAVDGCPTEQYVADSLHPTLSPDDPLSLMSEVFLGKIRGQDRGPSLLDLHDQGIVPIAT